MQVVCVRRPKTPSVIARAHELQPSTDADQLAKQLIPTVKYDEITCYKTEQC